jgi:hypothetical protein
VTDRPVGKEPEQVVAWLESHVEDKRHKRRAREVHKLFNAWCAPHEAGFKKVAPLVATGEMPRANFDQDKEKAVAYCVENYQCGPIVTMLFWCVIKAIITKLVLMLFEYYLEDPEALTIYLQTSGEPPHERSGRRA